MAKVCCCDSQLNLLVCAWYDLFCRMYTRAYDQISIQKIQVFNPVSLAVSSLCHITVSNYSDAEGHILVRKRYLQTISVTVFLET